MISQIAVFIKNNISIIKDIFTIIFVSTGTIVSIKTYQKAKRTILQPLRSEVIKRQTELYIKLLEFISNEAKVISLIDYNNIIKLNVSNILKELCFSTKVDNKLDKWISEVNAGGVLLVKDDEEITSFSIPKVFSLPNQNNNYQEYKKDLYKLAQDGNYKLEILYYTKRHSQFTTELREIANSPFIPEQLKEKLMLFIDEISYNLQTILKNTLESSINEFCSVQFEKGFNLNEDGVYNQFISKYRAHKDSIIKIKKETKSILRIDEKW